jgi:hypothetical protein
MSPGPVEEAGQTARSLVDALKRDPFSLSMIVINVLLLGYLYLQGITAEKDRQQERELLYQNRREVGELLAKCYPAPPNAQQHQ